MEMHGVLTQLVVFTITLDQTGNLIPGAATDIGVGADGTVWVVNSADQIFRLNSD